MKEGRREGGREGTRFPYFSSTPEEKKKKAEEGRRVGGREEGARCSKGVEG